jgi:protein transport protein SEC24
LQVNTDRIPSTSQAFNDSQIPFGVSVKPFGELPSGDEVPTVSFKNDPIVRCKDCRAYINPFVRWVENGQRWICPFCGDVNKTEGYYYSTIEEDGYRTDHEERPEFSCGTVDFIANHEYMNRPPMPPTFLFAFDVSKPAIQSGYLQVACQTIKNAIEQQLLPGLQQERVKIAFLTYNDSV